MYNPINFDSGTTGSAIGQGDEGTKLRLLLAKLLERGGATSDAQTPMKHWSQALPGATSTVLDGMKKGIGHWKNPDTGLMQTYGGGFGSGFGGLFGGG